MMDQGTQCVTRTTKAVCTAMISARLALGKQRPEDCKAVATKPHPPSVAPSNFVRLSRKWSSSCSKSHASSHICTVTGADTRYQHNRAASAAQPSRWWSAWSGGSWLRIVCQGLGCCGVLGVWCGISHLPDADVGLCVLGHQGVSISVIFGFQHHAPACVCMQQQRLRDRQTEEAQRSPGGAARLAYIPPARRPPLSALTPVALFICMQGRVRERRACEGQAAGWEGVWTSSLPLHCSSITLRISLLRLKLVQASMFAASLCACFSECFLRAECGESGVAVD